MTETYKNQNLSFKPAVQFLYFLLMNTFLFNHHFKVGVNLYLSDFIAIAIIGFTILHWLQDSPPPIHRSFLFSYFILFLYFLFLVFYAYVILENDTSAILGRFRHLFIYPLLFFSGLTFIHTKKDIETAFTYIRIHILFAITFGVLSIFYPSLNFSRIYLEGEIVDTLYFMLVPYGTALFCCLLFIYELLELSKKSAHTFRSFFFMLISTIGIVGTQNRSLLGTFIIMIILAFFYSFRAQSPIKERMRIFLSFLILLSIIGGFWVVQSPVYDKFKRRINQTINAFSGNTNFFATIPGVRIGRTIATYREWIKSPIIGCGWGNQITEFKIYDFDGNYIRTNYGTPHNYYITILYQTGLIGFLIMMHLYFRMYRKIKPKKRLQKDNTYRYTFLIFFIGFMIFNIANTHLYGNPVFIPVFFFLMGSMVSFSTQEQDASSNGIDAELKLQPDKMGMPE